LRGGGRSGIGRRVLILTEWGFRAERDPPGRQAGRAIFLVNARVSDRSAPGVPAGCAFGSGGVRRLFTAIQGAVGTGKGRLFAAGADPQTVDGDGKLQVDWRKPRPEKEAVGRGVPWRGRRGARRTVAAGQGPTGGRGRGADRDLYRRLRGRFPRLPVLVPRALWKGRDAVQAESRRRLACVQSREDCGSRRGVRLRAGTRSLSATPTGELMGFYGNRGHRVLTARPLRAGPRNMIEPCLCGRGEVGGPFHENSAGNFGTCWLRRRCIQVRTRSAFAREIRAGWRRRGGSSLRWGGARRKGPVAGTGRASWPLRDRWLEAFLSGRRYKRAWGFGPLFFRRGKKGGGDDDLVLRKCGWDGLARGVAGRSVGWDFFSCVWQRALDAVAGRTALLA
jgi:hypothetical protein